MKHPSEEQLLLYHYGELEDLQEIAAHLDTCDSCKAGYQGLRQMLALLDTAPVPERSESYGQEVWQRLRPRLSRRSEPAGGRWLRAGFAEGMIPFPCSRWAVAAAFALLLLAAFLAGRSWTRSGLTTAPPVALSKPPISPQARERILFKEIGDHLERSQLALIELINSRTNGLVDISLEQALARQLVDVNRLYRQTAARLGEAGMASVLEDLERTLIEISNSPSKLSSVEFAEFRRRIDTDDMLFKVKVVSSRVRAKEREAARELAGNRS